MNVQGRDVSRRATLTAGAGVGLWGLMGMGTSAQAATRPTLRRGSKGTYVTQAQKRLNALGYWCGSVDGSFGHLTQQAVWALQKVNKVSRSGAIDATAWSLLDKGAKPKARSTSGTYIEVDLKRQILICVKSGVVQRTLNTSTGNGERYYSRGKWRTAYTPTGSYSIYTRHTSGWQDGPLGAMWRPTYWKGGWAIHGSTSIPPYPASHGCCRVSTAGMDSLYAQGWSTIGRKVWVY